MPYPVSDHMFFKKMEIQIAFLCENHGSTAGRKRKKSQYCDSRPDSMIFGFIVIFWEGPLLYIFFDVEVRRFAAVQSGEIRIFRLT